MIAIDICIETFDSVPYLERPALVAKAGFGTIECWFPDSVLGAEAGPALRQACDAAGVRVNNVVVNAPDGSIGGSLVDPADRPGYLARVTTTLALCEALGAKMAITCSGNRAAHLSESQQRESLVEGLKAAGDLAGAAGVTLVLEPLNSLVDHAGYFLDQPEAGAEVVEKVGHSHVKMLFDCYHMQIMRGNLLATIERFAPLIGHFHAAGVPGRHELDTGELAYPRIVEAIAGLGYSGCFGLEYFPQRQPDDSLAAMRQLLADR